MRQLGLITCLLAGLQVADTAAAQSSAVGNNGKSDLRELLRAASEDGWVEFVPGEKNVKAPVQNNLIEMIAEPQDCSILAGYDPNGLFSENPLEDRQINNLLPKLLEGIALSEAELQRFEGLGKCGPEFATWEHLALSQMSPTAVPADTGIAGLYFQSMHIRRRAGVTLAIATGLTGDRASLRRYADMLQDAGLHNTKVTQRDPRHILLDALLLESSDFNDAKQRYEWLSRSDGPEQIIALDRLSALGPGDVASDTLDRLGDDLIQKDPSRFVDLKVSAALQTGELSKVLSLLKSEPINFDDVSNQNRTALINVTRNALTGDDAFERIAALDLYSEFLSSYADQDLSDSADKAFDLIFEQASEEGQTVGAGHIDDPLNILSRDLEKLNSEGVDRFISDISTDLMSAERILSNG